MDGNRASLHYACAGGNFMGAFCRSSGIRLQFGMCQLGNLENLMSRSKNNVKF